MLDEIDHQILDILIENNEFIMDGSNAAIQGWSAQDVLIRNNKFSGNSDQGIYLGFAGSTCSNWTILGNNFNNLKIYPRFLLILKSIVILI